MWCGEVRVRWMGARVHISVGIGEDVGGGGGEL